MATKPGKKIACNSLAPNDFAISKLDRMLGEKKVNGVVSFEDRKWLGFIELIYGDWYSSNYSELARELLLATDIKMLMALTKDIEELCNHLNFDHESPASLAAYLVAQGWSNPGLIDRHQL